MYKQIQNLSPLVCIQEYRIHAIHGAHVRCTTIKRDYASFSHRKQIARSSLARKNARVWFDKGWSVDKFSRRVRSVKCCYIPANSSDNPRWSLLPCTFWSFLFRTPSHAFGNDCSDDDLHTLRLFRRVASQTFCLFRKITN